MLDTNLEDWKLDEDEKRLMHFCDGSKWYLLTHREKFECCHCFASAPQAIVDMCLLGNIKLNSICLCRKCKATHD
jgi:hypothetical protein